MRELGILLFGLFLVVQGCQKAELGQPSLHTMAEIFPEGQEVVKLGEFENLTEGPVAVGEEAILFSNVHGKKTLRYDVESGAITVFREETGGANGLMYDRQGRLVRCEGLEKRIGRLDQEGNHEVVVDRYEGKRFNGPNDLDIDQYGGIYFSDPQFRKNKERVYEMDVQGVYYVSPDGVAKRVLDHGANGVHLSLDEKELYVVSPKKEIRVYPIVEPGKLGENPRVIQSPSSGDGLTVDEFGNLYSGGRDLFIFNPKGELVGTIEMEGFVTNLVFGGKDYQTLFITSFKGRKGERKGFLHSIRLNVRGRMALR